MENQDTVIDTMKRLSISNMHFKEANTSRGQTQRQPTKNSICTGGLDLGPTTCESLWFGIRDQQTIVACESCPYISYIHGMGFSLQRVDLLTAKKGLSDLAVQLLQDCHVCVKMVDSQDDKQSPRDILALPL